MRVIAGMAKGHKLIAPEGLETRPTTDRIKETLFNILSSNINIYGTKALDLFCGSGAIGIEMLSRGAKEAVFVDNNVKAIEVLNYNLEHTKLSEKSVVLKCDVLEELSKLKEQNEKFDIIFLDPPYDAGLYEIVLNKIIEFDLLNVDGILVAEQPSKNAIHEITGLKLLRQKDYRKTILSFWTLEG